MSTRRRPDAAQPGGAIFAVLVVACAILLAADILLGGLGLGGAATLIAGLAIMFLGHDIGPMLRQPEDYYDR